MNEAIGSMVDLGPELGGLMVHTWIDLAVFILSIFVAVRLGKAQLIQPFVLIIGLGALSGFLIMVANQSMWIAQTVRSILFLVAILWLAWMLRPVKPSVSQSADKLEK